MKLKDWESHVLLDPILDSKGSPRNGPTYCGHVAYNEFVLLGVEHALACVEQDTYAQPCPACLKAIKQGTF